ncbi:MAG TPA: hypothetical protein VHE99_08650 [Gammaproteobacteria bacterium]|nr:hypothetical protein [Gammaproteobacteria bacterium]
MVAETRTRQKNTKRANYDSPWKHSLEFYLQDFMEFCLPHIAELTITEKRASAPIKKLAILL